MTLTLTVHVIETPNVDAEKEIIGALWAIKNVYGLKVDDDKKTEADAARIREEMYL